MIFTLGIETYIFEYLNSNVGAGGTGKPYIPETIDFVTDGGLPPTYDIPKLTYQRHSYAGEFLLLIDNVRVYLHKNGFQAVPQYLEFYPRYAPEWRKLKSCLPSGVSQVQTLVSKLDCDGTPYSWFQIFDIKERADEYSYRIRAQESRLMFKCLEQMPKEAHLRMNLGFRDITAFRAAS